MRFLLPSSPWNGEASQAREAAAHLNKTWGKMEQLWRVTSRIKDWWAVHSKKTRRKIEPLLYKGSRIMTKDLDQGSRFKDQGSKIKDQGSAHAKKPQREMEQCSPATSILFLGEAWVSFQENQKLASRVADGQPGWDGDVSHKKHTWQLWHQNLKVIFGIARLTSGMRLRHQM